MRSLITIPLFLIALFTLAMGLSQWIGHTQPTSDRIQKLHLTDCALPCWDSITLGNSSLRDVSENIPATFPGFISNLVNAQFLVWQNHDTTQNDMSITVVIADDKPSSIAIRTNYAAKVMPNLGEMLLIFGAPTCAAISQETGYVTVGYENDAHQTMLQFTASQPSLLSPVRSMVFGLSKTIFCQKTALPWRDFLKTQHLIFSPS